MVSAQAAKHHATARFQAEGSRLIAARASRDKRYGVWVVSYRDPEHPDEMLIGGAVVVTDAGEVHSIGSTPDAVDTLMLSLRQETRPAPPPPWPDVLGEALVKPEFTEVLRFVEQQRLLGLGPIYPPQSETFAAFHLTPFDQVKVVILGQDPYHQRGQANGLAFAVSRATRPLPPSLRNIHAAMVHDGYIAPSHGDLSGWAQQGVLLLNTALSVQESQANSHAKEWGPFTDAVITKISDRERPVVFVLWGNQAQRKRRLINEDRHEVITAPHPAARGHFQTIFREAGTFKEVNRRLQALKETPIDWERA